MKAARAILALSLLASAAFAQPSDFRVYVVVIDSLHPSEVGPTTPTLSELRAGGTWYEESRSVMIAETLPNHVAMMTGVKPSGSGIVANDYSGGRMESPALLEAPTLVTRIETECSGIHTATIQSKTYLYRIFQAGGAQRQADFHWNPFPVIPVSDHAPDAATMQGFLDWIGRTPAPHFAFVNLGDVDRSGHGDPSGNTGLPAFRRANLLHTDTQLGRLVESLKASGAWQHTILFVVSDHSMDWSLPTNFINLTSALTAAGFAAGTDFRVVQNGGADMVYVPSPAKIAGIAEATAEVTGVDFVLTPETRADYGLDHGNAGEVIAFAEPGYRFSDPQPFSNPIPGNHGHAVTQRSVLLVAGGHAALAPPTSVPGDATLPSPFADRPGNASIAPTVAALFGLASPPGTYDVSPLAAAFDAGVLDGGIGPCP